MSSKKLVIINLQMQKIKQVLSNQQGMINEIGRGKLLLISTLNKKNTLSSVQLQVPLSHRQKLIKHRQLQLNKIRNQISALIQTQLKSNQQQQSVIFDFGIPGEISERKGRRSGNERRRRCNKSVFSDKGVEGKGLDISLSENLIAKTKKIEMKQKMWKHSQSTNLPKIENGNKTNARFNYMQGKIEPWRYKVEDFGSF